MRRFLPLICLLMFAAVVRPQPATFTPTCTGNATTDTTGSSGLATIATSIIGATNPGTIHIPWKSDVTKRCKLSADVTFTANITIDDTDGSGIDRNGHTVTVQGPIINPAGKTIFFGSGSAVITAHCFAQD